MSDDAIDLKTPEAPSSINFKNSLKSFLQTPSQSQQQIQSNDVTTGTISSESSSSFFSGMSLFRYFLIILILAFLGINLFGYMEVVTNYIVLTFKPILSVIASFFGISIAETATATVNVTSTGLKKGIDITSETIKKGANILKQASLPDNIKENNENMTSNDTIINKLSNRVNDKKNISVEPLPDSSDSSIQNKNKKNYCFVGSNSNGTRSCAEMNETDKCMSGDIFPSLDICVNPNLR